MTAKKKELIELMLDVGITPESWPVDTVYAAQDKNANALGENALMFYYGTKIPEKSIHGDFFNGYSHPNEIKLNSLCKNWSKTIITKDQFIAAYNERNKQKEWPAESDIDVVAHNGEVESPVNAISVSTQEMLAERGARYGRFEDGAEIMQQLKVVSHCSDGWKKMKPIQREAMDMIMHKIGRILNGDPSYDDSWKDIAGFSTLVVDWLHGDSK